MIIPPRLGVIALAALILGGCRAAAPVSEAPTLRLVRTVVLRDSTNHRIGWPADLSVAANGDLLFVDLTVPEVVAFDATGRFLRRYGTPGDGPGELQAPRSPVVLNDTLVVVADAGHQTVEVFDRGSARFLQRVRLPSSAEVLAQGAGGTLLAGALNLSAGNAYLRWTPFAESAAAKGSIPDEYRASRRAAGIYRRVFVTALDSASAFIVEGSAHLGVEPDAGTVRWHSVPARLRKAPPPALETRLTEAPSDSVFTLFAFVDAIGALPTACWQSSISSSGFSGLDVPAPTGTPLTNTLYLTEMDIPGQRACVDAVVPTDGEMVSQPTLRGDTLYVLEQTTDSLDARTTVTAHHIETKGCRWHPLEGS